MNAVVYIEIQLYIKVQNQRRGGILTKILISLDGSDICTEKK